MWAGRVTIETLPDDVLLPIFYFDGLEDVDPLHPSWHRLVHVCRRWRSVVFASPNFLDLRLVCGPGTRVELTDIWPPLPIIIRSPINWPMPDYYDFKAAIVHRSRVREIDLRLSSNWQLRRLASAMQEPFPALKRLKLEAFFEGYPLPVLSDGLFGGSFPHLQSLEFRSISFPALPKLLLSASDLVDLTLWEIPDSGYILPETLVTCLAVLANLKSLTVETRSSPAFHPDWDRQHLLPSTRTVLPSLTHFEFLWICRYLEDLVARIDAPLLDSVNIILLYEETFNVSQLGDFMRRTRRFQALNEAHVDFDPEGVMVTSTPPTQTVDKTSGFSISSGYLSRDLSSLMQILTSLFSSICTVEHLYIYEPDVLLSNWEDALQEVQWPEIFLSFPFVKSLYLSKEIAQYLAPILQELVHVEESATNVLPALEIVFLEDEPSGPVQEAIGLFIAARQSSGHPVVASHWNRVRTPKLYS